MSYTKTNIRINGDFIFKDEDNNYYLSKISKLKKWKKMKDNKLNELNKCDITSELEKLKEHFNIQKNVNFLIDKNIHTKNKDKKTIHLKGGTSL